MSEPTAPAAAQPEPAATGLGTLLRACVLLLVVLGIPFALWSRRTSALDATELYGSLFCAEPPAGWRIGSAHRLPDGANLLLLEAEPGAASGPSELGVKICPGPGPVLAAFASPGMDPGEMEGIEEPKPPAAESAPGADGARSMQGMGPVEKEIERGDLSFGSLTAAFARLRTTTAGKPYKERMRVNLTSGKRYALLVAGWPEGRDASKKEMEALLEKLQVRFEAATADRQEPSTR